MINIFKSLNPLNILWLIILFFPLRFGYLLHLPASIDFAFADLYSRLLIPASYRFVLSPVQNVLIAGILVFAQALLLNHLVNHYNLLGKPTFLPALMYMVLSALFMPFVTLSAPLVCNFLLIWMLYKVLDLYKGNDAKSSAYDLGLIVAIGTLIYLPFVYLFLILCIGLIIFKPFNWREWIAGVLGYATVFFFLAVYYFLYNSLGRFYSLWLPLSTKFSEGVHLNYYNCIVLIPVVIILGLCLVTLQQNFFKSYVQTRKSFQLLFIVFVIAGLTFYVQAAFRVNHFILCAVPATVFFSYYFLYSKRRWVYESLFWLLIISIIYFQFNTF